MKNYKFFLGLGAGLVMGLSIANLQPLKAADEGGAAALQSLVNEVRQMKGDVRSIAGNTSSMSSTLRGMSSDLKTLNQRSNISPKAGKKY